MPLFLQEIPQQVEILGPNAAGVQIVRCHLLLPTQERPESIQGKLFVIGDSHTYMIHKAEAIETLDLFGEGSHTRYLVEGGRYA
jgi:hypothetical protein